MKKPIADEIENSEKSDVPMEVRVWQAVITSTVDEWIHGPLSRRREAEQYLFEDKNDFRLVCESAGVDPDRLRARLVKFRDQAALGAHARCNRN